MADLHATAMTRLRADGQRYTTGRRAIIEVLQEAERPLSIPELIRDRDDLAQSSAYRNLAVLEQAGVVHRIVTNDEFARYELAEDLTEHHHHLICSSCGAIDDFTVSAQLEADLERVLHRAATRHKFRPASHKLDLIGVCVRCS
jgi:Fe2+ or Zn2+ uptake regulation protein